MRTATVPPTAFLSALLLPIACGGSGPVPPELRRRLELSHQAGTWHSPPYLAWLREHRGLTPREAEVASLAVQGITAYAELGDQLGISPNTVKHHVTRLLDRAGVDSLVDFIFRAHGIRP